MEDLEFIAVAYGFTAFCLVAIAGQAVWQARQAAHQLQQLQADGKENTEANVT